jgi:hypothetical protein
MNVFSSLRPVDRVNEIYFLRAFHFLISRMLYTDKKQGKTTLGEICGTRFGSDEEVRIRREFELPDKSGRVDIRVLGRKKCYYIELKLDSPIGKDQVYRYKKALDALSDIPRTRKGVILISKWQLDYNERNTPDVEWRWSRICDIITSRKVNDSGTKEYVRAFMEYMEELGMSIKQVSWEYKNGIKALMDLRLMIETVLKEIDGKIKTTFSAGGSFAAFNFQEPKILKGHYVRIYWGYPEYLYYEIPKKVSKSAIAGTDFELEKGYPHAELSFEEEKFFCLSKDEQFDCLKDFFSWSMKDAKKIARKK